MERVRVRVRGMQVDEAGEQNVIETAAIGRYCLRGGKHYVLYEVEEKDKQAQTSTVLKFDETRLTLLRHGAIEHRQEFIPRVKSCGCYRTVAGDLQLEVHTHELKVNFGAGTGTVDVCYDLAVNGQLQSHNSLHIEVNSFPEGQAD